MANYLFLFRGGEPSQDMSPDEMQQYMQKWFVWIKSMQDQGIYKGGDPLEATGKVVSRQGNQYLITDGPYAEAKEVIGGYVKLEAQSIEQAAEIAKGCPTYELGGEVIVQQVQEIEM